MVTNRYQPTGIQAEFEPGSRGRVLRTQDICQMHALWLEDIYAWAGQYRTEYREGWLSACPRAICPRVDERIGGRRHEPAYALPPGR